MLKQDICKRYFNQNSQLCKICNSNKSDFTRQLGHTYLKSCYSDFFPAIWVGRLAKKKEKKKKKQLASQPFISALST